MRGELELRAGGDRGVAAAHAAAALALARTRGAEALAVRAEETLRRAG